MHSNMGAWCWADLCDMPWHRRAQQCLGLRIRPRICPRKLWSNATWLSPTAPAYPRQSHTPSSMVYGSARQNRRSSCMIAAFHFLAASCSDRGRGYLRSSWTALPQRLKPAGVRPPQRNRAPNTHARSGAVSRDWAASGFLGCLAKRTPPRPRVSCRPSVGQNVPEPSR